MRERRQKSRKLIQRYYRDVPSRETLLDGALSPFLRPSAVLFDAGCGSDLPLLQKYGAQVSLAIGLDLCAPTVSAPANTSVLIGDLTCVPLKDRTLDVVISRSVLEHLERPVDVFLELARLLRPGGKLVMTTPNKYYYSCLISRLFPEFLKDRYFQSVFGEDAYDHFPVYYRANTVGAFRTLSAAAGLRLERIEPIRHFPYYLVFSPLLFRLGMLYDWTITALGLRWLQSNWLVVMSKD